PEGSGGAGLEFGDSLFQFLQPCAGAFQHLALRVEFITAGQIELAEIRPQHRAEVVLQVFTQTGSTGDEPRRQPLHQAAQQFFDLRNLHRLSPGNLTSPCPVMRHGPIHRPKVGRQLEWPTFFRAATGLSACLVGWHGTCTPITGPEHRTTGSIRAPNARDPSDNDAEAMKMITAIIRPWKLDDLQMAVARLGVQGITVTEVTGYGRQRGHAEHYRGSEYQVEFVPKLRVEIVLDDASSEAVVEAITNVCRTGKTGDGKIFLAPVGEAVRIRTRESGAAAA